jgi:hypothetical protein
MEPPKTYSLNLITFIILKTDLEPVLDVDKETGLVYGVFPICRGVTYAIRDFRRDKCKVEIHSFLSIYKQLKEKIRDMRGGYNVE